ncbi:diguanylate cyclase and metal dependent phosphohydrolase [Candidatus Vecturithrix granuli]|uniref:Diguanylate cyclase and metal dependent phosphohydrolase n=1 Tax=Vecturithrix granuli TaxID=1499967 RepID=A0A081C2X1_VECG1|nr:diguanylate cyclase and metal dependent phosphohydrolase [Candidatus Vecturithrix granuli]
MKDIQDVHDTTPRAQHRRPTMSLLLPGLDYGNEEHVWLGARDAARASDVNLITVVGGHLNAPEGFSAQANVLYDLIQPKRFDGVAIFSSTVGWYLDSEGLAAFCGRYHPLPQISMDAVVAGIPSLIKDEYTGIRDVLIHLIEIHGYRRIAFLRGPESHAGTQECYRAYCETLAACGLPVVPKLISPPTQGWDQAAAVSVMEGFLDDCQLRPGHDFEAIVAATDNLARNAIKVLQARGFCVPQDVAVTGFDDEREGRVITPPLTTVPFPTYEMGQRGVEIFLSLWQGEDVPDEIVIPVTVVIRQSCGCQSPVVLQAEAEADSRSEKDSTPPVFSEPAWTAQCAAIIAEITDLIDDSDQDQIRGQAERLVEAFSAETQQTSPGEFLVVLENILQEAATAGANVAIWQNAISVLRRRMLPVLSHGILLARAENVWGKARADWGSCTAHTGVPEYAGRAMRTGVAGAERNINYHL